MWNPYGGWQSYVRAFFHEAGALPAMLLVRGSPHEIEIIQPATINQQISSSGITQSWQAHHLILPECGNEGILAQVTQHNYIDTAVGICPESTTQAEVRPMQILDQAMDIYSCCRIWYD